jgi:hypothetical protein
MKIQHLFVLAILFFCASSVFAGPDGSQVLRACQQTLQHFDEQQASDPNPLGTLDSGWCLGWVTAVIEMNNLKEGTADKDHPLRADMFHFCAPPSGLTAIQAIRIVVKYLKDHPKDLQHAGIGLTNLALMSAFPCKPT